MMAPAKPWDGRSSTLRNEMALGVGNVGSFEAIAWARKEGALGEYAEKWLTVPTRDVGDAIAAFRAIGYETRGLTILTQAEATARAETIS